MLNDKLPQRWQYLNLWYPSIHKSVGKSFRNSPFTSPVINTALHHMKINMSGSADTQRNADYNSTRRTAGDKFSLKWTGIFTQKTHMNGSKDHFSVTLWWNQSLGRDDQSSCYQEDQDFLPPLQLLNQLIIIIVHNEYEYSFMEYCYQPISHRKNKIFNLFWKF